MEYVYIIRHSVSMSDANPTARPKTGLATNMLHTEHTTVRIEKKSSIPMAAKCTHLNRVLEEDGWLSGSELKTDNSSSSDGEGAHSHGMCYSIFMSTRII